MLVGGSGRVDAPLSLFMVTPANAGVQDGGNRLPFLLSQKRRRSEATRADHALVAFAPTDFLHWANILNGTFTFAFVTVRVTSQRGTGDKITKWLECAPGTATRGGGPRKRATTCWIGRSGFSV